MKKLVATLCLAGTTLALSACDTTSMGEKDILPPYGLERTAQHQQKAEVTPVVVAPVAVPVQAATPTKVKPAEKVFQRAQTK